MSKYTSIKNNQSLKIQEIPVLKYEDFLVFNTTLVADESKHCVNYFGYKSLEKLKLICCIADDLKGTILISSAEINQDNYEYPSFSAQHLTFHVFERTLHENFGINYSDHPWLKPVRFAFNRADKNSTIANYPFYQIKSEELHEVGVGPVHAGIIEPGHFRFICNGEQILHLEMQNGFQHRGIENLFLNKKTLLQRTILAESIAGDTVAGHTTAFVNLWESLCLYKADADLKFTRTLALELERMAIHTGDLSAICSDMAYQLGGAVFGRLRTPIINFFQMWCGNRLAKGLLRVGSSPFHFSAELAQQLEEILTQFEIDYTEMYKELKDLPSALSRMEKTGVITREQSLSIGTVGITAKSSGYVRDIRATHPHDLYFDIEHHPIIKNHSDVYSRIQIRNEEILQSMTYIRKMLQNIPPENQNRKPLNFPQANTFSLSLTEGWRGEICHCALTDERGELTYYSIKDPSVHNWTALALAVRNNEISDFPIINKSFNLSYCGYDL